MLKLCLFTGAVLMTQKGQAYCENNEEQPAAAREQETGKMAFCIFLCRNGVIPNIFPTIMDSLLIRGVFTITSHLALQVQKGLFN